MCGLGKDDEMELKAREEKEGWCFLMSVSQTMSICGQIAENGMWGLERKHLYIFVSLFWPSLVAQSVKNLPAKQETRVWSLVRDEPLEKGLVAYSSIFVWRILWTEEPGGLQSKRPQRVGHNWITKRTHHTVCFLCIDSWKTNFECIETRRNAICPHAVENSYRVDCQVRGR